MHISARLFLMLLIPPFLNGCGTDVADPAEMHDYMTVMPASETYDLYPSQTIEDRYGYRWIRSSNGLYIHDGTNYLRCISTDDPGSLSSSHVNSIMADTHGDIWVATQLGIDRYDFPSRTFIHYSIDDSNRYITDIEQAAGGEIYAVSRRFLFKLDRDSGQFDRQMPLKPTGEKISLSADDDGFLYIDYSTSQDKVCLSSDGPVIAGTVVTPPEDISSAVVIGDRPLLSELERRSVTGIQCQDDDIWAVTSDNLLLKFSWSEDRLTGEYPISEITGQTSPPRSGITYNCLRRRPDAAFLLRQDFPA